MRYKTLTVKVPEDLLEDLEAYALQEFPDDCRVCKGSGELEGQICSHCAGTAVKGNKSEATRYLLHFALGQASSPEARAMAAAYADVRSRLVGTLVGTMNDIVQRFEADFHDQMVQAMRELTPTVGG